MIWRVEARYQDVIALMDHLRAEGIQRLARDLTPQSAPSAGSQL